MGLNGTLRSEPANVTFGWSRRAFASTTSTGQVITAVRRAKSQARLPLRTPVTRVVVTGPRAWLAAARAAEADLAAAGRVAAFGYRERPEPDGLDVRVELAAAEEATT